MLSRVKIVHFLLKYNGLAIVRKTTKLIEGGHHGLQDYICYYFYVFTFFTFFQNPKSRDFFTFFAVFRTFSRTIRYIYSNSPLVLLAARGRDYDYCNALHAALCIQYTEYIRVCMYMY